MTEDRSVTFGPYRLDRDGLRRGRQEVRLTPKTLALLRLFAARAGQIVSKDDLFDAVWPDATVSDSALNSCIQELRQALGDDARRPRYLETRHRRGYRFIPAVDRASASVAPPGAPAPPPIVGRARELAQLREWLEVARGGDRQIIFVTGEPGMGKTTVVETLLAEVARHGVLRVGRGQCVEHYGAGEPYLPILDALGRLCRGPDGERVVQALARHAPTWLVQMPSVMAAPALRAAQRRGAGATRERMLRELTEAVEAFTRDVALVLCLEDLHWSDVSTLDWLAFLARRRDPARLLLIGTYRPAEVLARDHPLGAVKQELQLHRRCRELAVSPLDEGAVAEYLRWRCPFEQGQADAFGRLGRVILGRTEGNPLFMVNVVDDLVVGRVLVERGDRWEVAGSPEAAPVAVPADIRQMIERQLARLSPVERSILEVASAVGAEFSTALVAAAAAMTPAAVEAGCAALGRREQFLRPSGVERWPDGTIAAAFAFSHALYREALYERVPGGRRAELHARVGARLEAAHGARTADVAAVLAMHFERGGDPDRAVRHLEQAGRNAIARSAPREAVLDLGRALSLLEALPETPARAARELGLQIALGGQLMTLKGWAAPEVERAYDRARTLGEGAGDAPQLFPALWGLWLFSWGRGDMPRARAIADDLLVRARRTDDVVARLEAHHAQWATRLSQGELAAALDHARRGFALYDAAAHAALASLYGNHDPGMCSRGFGAWTLGLLGFPERALEGVAAAGALSERLGDPFNLAWGHYYAAVVHQFRREPRQARARAEAALALAREHDFGLVSGWMTAVRGWGRAAEGMPGEGIPEIERGLAATDAMGAQRFRSYLLALLADACLAAERVEDGLTAVADGLASSARTGERFYEAELWRLRGELLRRTGADRRSPLSANPGSPEACFRTAREVARDQGARWLELRAAVSLSRLRDEQGGGGEARGLLLDAYRGFTEGLETPDLLEARSLLDRLG